LQQGNTFKLADMNVSKIKEDGRMTCTNVGTPLYKSPEVARHEFYNEKCDIWSLGVVVYELCCFKNPFTLAIIDKFVTNKDKQTKEAIPKIPLRYSKCLSDLIKRMLAKDPEERISINEILQICQNQGMEIQYMSSKEKIAEFKTIVFPS
jgi:serine/threonine protein kinase